MKSLKIIATFCFVLLFWNAAVAQKTVELLVTDYYSDQALGGAWILTGRNTDTLYTDSRGRIVDGEFRDEPFITIGYPGYLNDTLVVTKPGFYKVRLRSVSVNLAQVGIVSESADGIKLNTPISGHRLNTREPYTFDGLQTQALINSIPGVNWEQRGLGGSARISVRGSGWRSNFGIRGTRLYINQIPVSQPDGFGLPEMADPYFFESMEVFKGPAGMAYGGYSGGSVLMLTRLPEEYGLQFNFGVTAGSNRLLRAQAGASFTGTNFSVSLKGMSMVHKGFRQQEYVNRKLYSAEARWQPHANHKLNFMLFYGLANWGLPGDLSAEEADTNRRMANPYSLSIGARLEKEFVRGGITYSFSQGEHFASHLTFFGNWADKYNPYGTTPAFSGIKDERTVGGGFRELMELRFGEKVPLRGQIGFEYQTEALNGIEYQNTGGIEGAVKSRYKLNSHLFFVFAKAGLDLPLNFKLDAGLNMALSSVEKKMLNPDAEPGQKRSTSRPGFYPTVSLSKLFKEKYSVYARYQHGYTTPTLNEMISEPGNVNLGLRNERMQQIEIGTRGQLPGGKLSWGIGGYGHFFNNYIVPFYDDSLGILRFTNAGSARQFGAELEADWYAYQNNERKAGVKQVWLGLRYAFTEGRFTQFVENGNSYDGKWIPGVAANKVTLLFNMVLRYGFALNFDLNLRDGFYLNYANSDRVKGIFTGNARISWSGTLFTVLKPELFFGVNNFTDARDFSFIRVNAPAGRYLNPAQGVFFYGGVNIRSSSLFKPRK